MTTIAFRLQAVRERIADAARAAGRLPQEIRLLAVSKTWPATALREAYAAGQDAFGESYVQEAVEKIAEFNALLGFACGPDIESGPHDRCYGGASPEGRRLCPPEWHFIGPLQSNKTRAVAEHFAWVHTVERLKIAERLSAQRPPYLPPLQVCLQINVSGEASKSGAAPEEALELALAVARLPRLKLRGLMAIPAPTENVALQRQQFTMLRRQLQELNTRGLQLDTLSMGMSHDLEAAILEGATMVRVGTAIFGEREKD